MSSALSGFIQALSGAQLALCCTRARQAIDTKRGLGHAALDSLDIKLDILLVYTQICYVAVRPVRHRVRLSTGLCLRFQCLRFQKAETEAGAAAHTVSSSKTE